MMKKHKLFLTVPIFIASCPLAGHDYVDPVKGSPLLQLPDFDPGETNYF